MAKRHAKRHSKRSRPTRKHRGGGQGAGWTIGAAVAPQAPYAQVNQPYDACLGSPRPGQVSYSNTGGLPGMSKMHGGRYTMSLPEGGIAGFAQVDKIPCEPNPTNPLNQHGGAGLVGASDMGVYEAPTARYTTAPSGWTSSVGAPVLLNVPLDPTLTSKACVQTAGRRHKKSRNAFRKSVTKNAFRKSVTKRRGSRKSRR